MRAARSTACLLTSMLVVLAAGCGGDEGDTAADDPVDATTTALDAVATTGTESTESTEAPGDDDAAGSAVCPLLDGVDLAGLLGEPAGEPAEGFESCEVEAASAESRGGLSLVVSTNSAAENYDNRVELFGIDSELGGVGDQAFHSGPYLIVLDGDALLQLQVVPDAAVGFGVEDPLLEAAMATIMANRG